MAEQGIEERKYAQDGVNVVEGDEFSAFAGALCRSTYGNSPFVEVKDFSRGHFRGPRGFRLKNLPADCYLDAAPDGDGTKVVLTDAAGDYDNAAYGWIAMTCGDVTRWGGLPLVLVNNLDTASIGKAGDAVNGAFRAMLRGAARIANQQGLILFKGETAELPGLVTSPNPNATAKYLWSGVCIGVYDPRRIITGDQVTEGMIVMALLDILRNNGISSVRKAFVKKFGEDYYQKPEAWSHLRAAATPAMLYDKFLAKTNGWFQPDFKPLIPMHLAVHLTGGAIKSKLADDILFPRGLSADFDNLADPPEIMRNCAEWRGMSDDECYETWNGGQGELVVIDGAAESEFVAMAAEFGIKAQRAGKIVKRDKPSVIIQSKFTGKTITFTPKP
jgi:phosphoribosylaminoimidazole (AIR) synthetase